MKKSTLLIFAIVLSVFSLSNVSFKSAKSFVMTLVTEEPNLPESPFDYADIEPPLHLFSQEQMQDDIGYGRGHFDSLSFVGITDHGATLGRVLFYDKKLSAVEDISCGSCHHQELSFTENKAFSEGVNSLTKRNSMHLNDLAWSNDESFTWGMEKKDLHEMIILPLTDENEIGANIEDVKTKLEATTYYPELFVNAYGDSEITEERIVDALVQFIESMTTFNSRFDEGVKNGFADFTEEENLGLELFSVICSSCHHQGKHTIFGDVFLGNEMLLGFPFIFNNGLEQSENDLGAGEWDEAFSHLFKIPSLRNIELTGPYMHDGRFVNLEEVIDHYSDGIVENEWSFVFLPSGGFQLDEDQKGALLAFLKTLTDNTFITNPKWSDPFAKSLLTYELAIEDIQLYPNPMVDKAMIKFANPDNDIVSINVLTQDGRLIKHDRITTSEYELNKADFHEGVYFVQLLIGDKKSTQKLIIN